MVEEEGHVDNHKEELGTPKEPMKGYNAMNVNSDDTETSRILVEGASRSTARQKISEKSKTNGGEDISRRARKTEVKSDGGGQERTGAGRSDVNVDIAALRHSVRIELEQELRREITQQVARSVYSSDTDKKSRGDVSASAAAAASSSVSVSSPSFIHNFITGAGKVIATSEEGKLELRRLTGQLQLEKQERSKLISDIRAEKNKHRVQEIKSRRALEEGEARLKTLAQELQAAQQQLTDSDTQHRTTSELISSREERQRQVISGLEEEMKAKELAYEEAVVELEEKHKARMNDLKNRPKLERVERLAESAEYMRQLRERENEIANLEKEIEIRDRKLGKREQKVKQLVMEKDEMKLSTEKSNEELADEMEVSGERDREMSSEKDRYKARKGLLGVCFSVVWCVMFRMPLIILVCL